MSVVVHLNAYRTKENAMRVLTLEEMLLVAGGGNKGCGSSGKGSGKGSKGGKGKGHGNGKGSSKGKGNGKGSSKGKGSSGKGCACKPVN
jgi:hypothetical protein